MSELDGGKPASLSRKNPFEGELYMDERHFASSFEAVAVPNQDEFPTSDLKISDDLHHSNSGTFGLSQQEQLEMSIENCKDMIMRTPEHSDRRKKLVEKLIKLRIQLHELREGPVEVSESGRVICGHKFLQQPRGGKNRYCERCNSIIWILLQTWYRCRVCGYSAHAKCLDLITRVCAGVKAKQNPAYVLKICPEVGLAHQKYRCAECKAKIALGKGKELEARLCDYSGYYYCANCHWNDLMVIPARVVHNWDFSPQKVSRCHKQFLKLMLKRPILKIESLNGALLNYVDELRLIKKMRSDALLMKCYFLCCKEAKNQRVLLKLQKRQHFVENADVYSLQDLLDLVSGQLVQELRGVLEIFLQHIKSDCEVCKGNGFVCELCTDKEIIFPFDDYVTICRNCYAVFHRLCFEKARKTCPRCVRRERRHTLESEQVDEISPSSQEPSSAIMNTQPPLASDDRQSKSVGQNPFLNKVSTNPFDDET